MVRGLRSIVERADDEAGSGASEAAVASYRSAVDRLGESVTNSVDVHDWVARAILSLGRLLGQLGRSEEEFAVYDDLVRRYGDVDVDGPSPSRRWPVREGTHARSD